MFKSIAKKPISKMGNYLKYGFVVMERETYFCPECRSILNAGPDYQPARCDRCGQKISYSGISWKKERQLGYAGSCEAYKPVKKVSGGAG